MKQKLKGTIVRWSKLTKKQRELIQKDIDYAMGTKMDEPDQYGLFHSIDRLFELGAQIILLPIEFMASFSDAVTREAMKKQDPVYISEILNMESPAPELWNTTSIGNMAYVTLNCHNLHVRLVCEKHLEDYLDWFLGKLNLSQPKSVN